MWNNVVITAGFEAVFSAKMRVEVKIRGLKKQKNGECGSTFKKDFYFCGLVLCKYDTETKLN